MAIELYQDSIDVRKMNGRNLKEPVEQQMQDELEKRIKITQTTKIPSEQLCVDGNQHGPNFVNIRRICRLPPSVSISLLPCARSVDCIYVVMK